MTFDAESAARVLALLEEREHVIQFGDDGWIIAHPLQERLDGSLFDCRLRWEGDHPGVLGRFWLHDARTIGDQYVPSATGAGEAEQSGPSGRSPLHQKAWDAYRRGELAPVHRAGTVRPESDYEQRLPREPQPAEEPAQLAHRFRSSEDVVTRYRQAPPIVRAAVDAVFDLEDRVDEMGYDISYYQEDLPRVVAEAIRPWASLDREE